MIHCNLYNKYVISAAMYTPCDNTSKKIKIGPYTHHMSSISK